MWDFYSRTNYLMRRYYNTADWVANIDRNCHERNIVRRVGYFHPLELLDVSPLQYNYNGISGNLQSALKRKAVRGIWIF